MANNEVDQLSDEQLAQVLGDNLAGKKKSVAGPDLTRPFDEFEEDLDKAAKRMVQNSLLAGATFVILGTGAVVPTGCVAPTPTPRPSGPTSEYQPAAYHEPTEAAGVVERIRLQDAATAAVIDEELLLAGVNRIGTEFPPLTGELPPLTPEGAKEAETGILPIELPDLVNLNWNEEFMEDGRPETGIEMLKVLTSMVMGRGAREGSVYNLAKVCPWLKAPIYFCSGQRTQAEQAEEVLPETVPWRATLRKDAQMGFLGRFRDGLTEKYVIAFSDWVFRGPDGQMAVRERAPRVSFAVVNEAQFRHLLKEVNPEIDYQDGYIIFPINGENKIYEIFIHTISPEIGEQIEIAAGLEYVPDARNPLVKYPPEELREFLPPRWGYSHNKGIRGAFPIDEQGNLGEKAILTVRYDEERNIWIWEKVEEKVIIDAPEIEGLKAVKEGERIVYYAETGNKYGVEVGEWAGEYRENVTMAVRNDEGKVESKKTGGLILNPLVAEKILWSEIAKIPDQKDKWLIVLPGDMTVLDPGKEIKIETEISKGSSKGLMVKVSFDGVVPMADIVPYVHKVIVLSSSYYGIVYMDQSVRGFSPCDQKICEGKEMYYLAAGGPLIDCVLDGTVQSKFGNQIARARGGFLVSVSAGKESNNITAKKILTIEGIPVFVAANSLSK